MDDQTRDGYAPAPPLDRLDPELVALAGAYGVSTDFTDWRGNPVLVPRSTLVSVLTALDVDAGTPQAVSRSLLEVEVAPWRRVLPPVLVAREGRGSTAVVHVPHGTAVEVWVELEPDGDGRPPQRVGGHRRDAAEPGAGAHRNEDHRPGKHPGSRVDLAQLDRWVDPRHVEGALVGEASFAVPHDLPLGWHTLHARLAGGEHATSVLVVTPAFLGLRGGLAARRTWGLMTQLYSVRSRASWGLGDLADLADLADWGARQGAGFVLVNPLHAAQPVPPMEPSPYLPTTRRFVNPMYIRVEDVRETAYLSATDRALVAWQAESAQSAEPEGGRLDRDAVWAAKKAALLRVFAVPRSPARQGAFEDFCAREGAGLRDFATWCVLAERYGLPHVQWPDDVQSPGAAGTLALQPAMAGRIDFYRWLQWVADEQLANAQRTALAAGMSAGIVHDLAVGVHPEGSDAWALGSALARGVTVGAPPDAFNQQGQDWSQPPWRPDRLAELGYAPYRDMLRTVLRHAGGLRVDHVVGLFRLWWVPNGSSPDHGTYVRYDHEALVGILALEAERAGAFVVGEDLGTVEPWARDYLRERGLLGTSILWFEKGPDGAPLDPAHWRELCLAAVTTHDLPPTAGYLAGTHIDLRERLGLLTRPAAEERAIDEADRAAFLSMATRFGALPAGVATVQQQVEGLHRLLLRAPSRLIGVQLADAVGDVRTQNQPGTSNEYPNWRVPLTDEAGRPVLLDDLAANERARSLARVLRDA